MFAYELRAVSASTGPDCNLSRLTEFALRVFVVKLLMGSISHNGWRCRARVVQIKKDINSPGDNGRLPGGSRDGVYLQTNSSINNWSLAGQAEGRQGRTAAEKNVPPFN